MHKPRLSKALVIILITIQVFGPATLWAAEQSGVQVEVNNRVIISAINEGALTAEMNSESRTLRFGETVNVGEELKTGNRTVVEVLIGNRAVITLGRSTAAQLTTVSPGQTTIQVTKGIVRVAASAIALGENGTLTIQTPTGQVKTHGGIFQVMVKVQNESLAQVPISEAKSYLTSYSPHSMVAALSTSTAFIQVEEGTAEIPGAGPGAKVLTVKSGQSMTLQSGQADLTGELEEQDTMRAGVLAKADHKDTPKEGVDNLVALQVDQATQLGQALTGASKTEKEEAEKKDASENPVNGATGGVQLANVVNTLFGGGNASNSSTLNPANSTGAGFGGNDNNGFFAVVSPEFMDVKVNGGENALLVFTRKDPVQSFVKEEISLQSAGVFLGTYEKNSICGETCLVDHLLAGKLEGIDANVGFSSKNPDTGEPFLLTPDFVEPFVLNPVASQFTVEKELVLIGGSGNTGHEGKAPIDTLIARGVNEGTNLAVFPTDRDPADIGLFPSTQSSLGEDALNLETPPEIVSANSTFVVERPSTPKSGDPGTLIGGTLAQFSDASANPLASFAPQDVVFMAGLSFIDGAITATGSNVELTGGVTLDRGTIATIGETTATNNYDTSLGGSDAKFDGSLLSVINGPTGPTALTVQDRLLGVYDGSSIGMEGGDKALLSVLDAKLTGPAGVPLIDINAAFKDADADTNNGRDNSGEKPMVTVTSAVVTRSMLNETDTGIPLDSALLEASAPLLALTKATMTTTSHFADLAGNQAQSIQLNDALVALNASQLMIENGNLLNLNNATATVNGYLFSLNNNSTLTIGIGNGNGTLFSVNNGSALNLNANALGVFGSGSNTLAIKNNLCAASCGTLLNSANAPFLMNGAELKVAGVTQDVVLPNSFNVFAGNPASTVTLSPDAALFHVDETSSLTINGTAVVKPAIP